MFRIYACSSHSYTYLIIALVIAREPTVWVFITSEYPGIHDIGLPNNSMSWQTVIVTALYGDSIDSVGVCVHV